MIEFWDRRYVRAEYVFGEEPNAFLRAQAERLRPGMRALAVADGEGRNGVWLAERGLEVTAIDASAVGLRKAETLAARRGVALRTEIADVADYPWPEAAFDVVVAIFIQFAEPVLRRAIFAGMERALAPGGLLLLEGYRPEQLGYRTGGPAEADKLYTRALLETAFPMLEIEHLAEYDASIEEGAGHAGLSALIDLVARKPL